jgi:hypothetical protein
MESRFLPELLAAASAISGQLPEDALRRRRELLRVRRG